MVLEELYIRRTEQMMGDMTDRKPVRRVWQDIKRRRRTAVQRPEDDAVRMFGEGQIRLSCEVV